MDIKILAIDLAKENFHLYGVDGAGQKVIDRMLRRTELLAFSHRLHSCSVVMEACGGSNFFAREFKKMGHHVRLISPQFVKPFVGHQKNDRNDARAIYEASLRPNIKSVGIKELWQQDLQALHRTRERIVKERICLTNQMRGVLIEYGFAIKRCDTHLLKQIPVLLECEEGSQVTLVLRRLMSSFLRDYAHLKDREQALTEEIKELAAQHPSAQRLQKIKGVGPMIATLVLASVGDGLEFKNGRGFSAWLGLVPKQHSSGGKSRLLGITKNGNSSLRALIIQGARTAVMAQMRTGYTGPNGAWVKQLLDKKGFNRTAVALANKNARHIWAQLVS
jgi:transposase